MNSGGPAAGAAATAGRTGTDVDAPETVDGVGALVEVSELAAGTVGSAVVTAETDPHAVDPTNSNAASARRDPVRGAVDARCRQPGTTHILAGSLVESHATVEHVERHLLEALTGRRRTDPEPVEGFGDAATRLDGDHPGCLVHVVGQETLGLTVGGHFTSTVRPREETTRGEREESCPLGSVGRARSRSERTVG